MVLLNLAFPVLEILTVLLLDKSLVSGESDVLSRLYKKAVKDNRPLILVLDNDSYGKLGKKPKNLEYNLESSENVGHKSANRLYQMLSETVLNKSVKSEKKSKKKATKSRSKSLLRQEAGPPKPNIIKSLLRISNDLRCAANNECKKTCPRQADKCEETPKKCEKKVEECEKKCEKKFECGEPEEEECNECAEEGACDACEKKDSCEACNR